MQVYGHRGAAGEAPENTIAGCLHAIDRGVSYIEIDLQLSADNQLVIVHDTTLTRTTHEEGKPRHYKASDLAKMDARADGPPWPRKKNCGIPTLQALLQSTDKLKGYQLEIKPDSKANIRRVCRLLIDFFPNAKAAHRVVVTSSSIFLHQCLAQFAPHLRRGMVITRREEISTLIELGCEYCVMHWPLCDGRAVRRLKKANIHISVWTVNDPANIKALYKHNVDSVITDYPSMAIPLVASLQRE